MALTNKFRIMQKKFKHVSFLLFIATAILSLQGCYTFTNATISPDTKTISIKQFPNNAPLAQPTLSTVLTETIRDKFTSQSRLSLVRSDGDLNVEGEIKNYVSEPIAQTSDQRASMQRLSITIDVRFTNKKDPKKDFQTSFTRFADFEASKQLSSAERELIPQITEALAQDIFNRALANW